MLWKAERNVKSEIIARAVWVPGCSPRRMSSGGGVVNCVHGPFEQCARAPFQQESASMLKFKLWQAMAWMVVAAAGVRSSEAAQYRLSDLLVEGATFRSGDKEFFNFHNFTENGNNVKGAENIILETLSQPNRNLDPLVPLPPGVPDCGAICLEDHGFRISSQGGWNVIQNENYNMGLDFSVRTLGSCLMYGVDLTVAGAVNDGQVDGSTTVTSGISTLAHAAAFLHDPGTDQAIDRQYFYQNGEPICMKLVDVDFSMTLQAANVAGAQASAQHFEVFFAQAAIPEPSTYALLLIGSAGVGLVVRRKRG
ncbi:MAG TPA: hypothetical protein DDY91_19535 [Planctomycetaceae bacterium]|nr:hypothetical protein [Planctomycetaceae bacterium]